MKKSFTPEQKKEYFQGLRARWEQAKAYSQNGGKAKIEAIIRNHGLNISPIGFSLIYMQMKGQGLEGLPYLDAKTFQGWKENGFKVRKGEKSTLSGITWIMAGSKEEANNETEDGYRFPKAYALFHRSQVEAI